MNQKVSVLATIGMLVFGGYVGYVTNYVDKTTAREVVIPRFTDVPRTGDLSIDINLNKEVVAIKGNNQEQNINVEIQKKDSIIYLTSVVEKEVPKYIRVREMPPVKMDKPSCTDILNSLKQFREEKSEP